MTAFIQEISINNIQRFILLGIPARLPAVSVIKAKKTADEEQYELYHCCCPVVPCGLTEEN
jgi:predicted transcriptional regulator